MGVTIPGDRKPATGRKHLLTTIVQVRDPTFGSITVTGGLTTGHLQGFNDGESDLVLSTGGVKIDILPGGGC
ncbi:hypothetical protein ACFQU9_37050 [Actinomadura namibiensis]|uniref:3-keto-L-gulonate-6-phosphate decarboxylase n=1 Tax=Actinomadura namibiensis TaxID=182080 RepID=A0A7W3LW94_ACTNM|nr:3-keto-L-gulonate-6-phosphate decarboxylase [Actinomadura namibiensis]